MTELVQRITTVVDRVQALPAAWIDRFVGISLALPSWTVLAIAAWLTPSPNGYGTHTQLGLGSCTMLTITGWPCPMCGMTTTFSLMAHGRLLDALENQPFGVVLFSITVLMALVGTAEGVGAHGIGRRVWAAVERREQLFALLLLIGLLGGWIYKSALLHPALFGGAG